jgi:hypothetical protein
VVKQAEILDIRAASGGLPLALIRDMPTSTPEHIFEGEMRSSLSPLVQRIESEYLEMPGLKLTEAQAQRLWGLDAASCRVILLTLVRKRFLRRAANGMYVRAGSS